MLSEQTMSNWLLLASGDWRAPVHEELPRQLLQYYLLHADEAKLQVLYEEGKSAKAKVTCGYTEQVKMPFLLFW